MKPIAYILLLIAAGLGVIGLVLLLKSESEKRHSVLLSLEKARQAKADKKRADDAEYLIEAEPEFVNLENHKDDASKKEKIN